MTELPKSALLQTWCWSWLCPVIAKHPSCNLPLVLQLTCCGLPLLALPAPLVVLLVLPIVRAFHPNWIRADCAPGAADRAGLQVVMTELPKSAPQVLSSVPKYATLLPQSAPQSVPKYDTLQQNKHAVLPFPRMLHRQVRTFFDLHKKRCFSRNFGSRLRQRCSHRGTEVSMLIENTKNRTSL